MAKRRSEPTQPRNPRGLTISQHIHSRAAIARFANERGLVTALRRPGAKPIDVRPDNPLFCAQRVWSQKTESQFFKSVEDAFQREVERAMSSGTINDHAAITAYFPIWQFRSKLALNPAEDIVLNGISDDTLTKDQEEILEKKGYMFTRGAVVPGRLAAHLDAVRQYDVDLQSIGHVRWGVLRGEHAPGLVCPDNPAGSLWVPVSRDVVLVAGYSDQPLPVEAVVDLNISAFEQSHSWVFGHPKDVRDFLQTNPNPWG